MTSIRELGVDMPARVAARPRDARGYPIPWVAFVRPDGAPDFRVLDDARRHEAIADRLCAICGEAMGYWVWFVGGPASMQNRLFNDPAMHEECARYAMAVCPFLSRGSARYRKAPTDAPDGMAFTSMPSSEAHPDRMGLGMTRGYELVTIREGEVIHAQKFTTIEWTEYPS